MEVWLKITEIWYKTKVILEELGADFSFILAGMLGAIVRPNRQKKLTKFEKFISILVGGVLANYITPLVLYWFNIKYNAGYGTGFVVGYSGLKSIEYLMGLFDNFKKDKKQ